MSEPLPIPTTSLLATLFLPVATGHVLAVFRSPRLHSALLPNGVMCFDPTLIFIATSLEPANAGPRPEPLPPPTPIWQLRHTTIPYGAPPLASLEPAHLLDPPE